MQIPGYTIIKKINAGGMATVFIATQHSVGRTVALKIMKSAFDKDPEFHQRFQREATIIGQLAHPNIIPIYDIGRHEGLNYISMEFLPKGSLDEKIKRGVSFSEAIKITVGIAAALEHAHSKGYIHRDIKPENILFREDESPVLTDFGIARTIKSNANMTHVGTVIGTPYYMSPEQAKGEASDGRSDLYSLGVVLYEMLTGEKLFHADSSLAISVKHIHEQPPKLPDELAHAQPLMDRLLAKKPEQRFQTAREVIDALGQLVFETSASQPTQGNALFAKLAKVIKRDANYLSDKSVNFFKKNTRNSETLLSQPTVTSDAASTQLLTQLSPQLATQRSPGLSPALESSADPHLSKRIVVYAALLAGFLFILWQWVGADKKPSAREQWASITQQNNAEAEMALIPLVVNPIPKEARVRILNIRDKYTSGLELPQGVYHLEISHPGYATKKKWIRLDAQNSIIDIALQRDNQPLASNSLPLPEMVLIKSGTFFMGNPNKSTARQASVEQDFYIGRYEITFNEYDFFAIETNRALPDDNGWGRGERPAINLSWDDAIAYINWLNKTTGKVYRLPTAIEWEYAARGNTTSNYWWGNNPEDARERANCRIGCKSWWDSVFDSRTQVVGAFPPNDFGLHDTAGNVAEWTNDCADKPAASDTNSSLCLKRAVRGGSFTSKVENIAAYSQSAVTASETRNNLGFRLVQEAPQIQVFDSRPASDTQQPRRRKNIFRDLRDTIFKREN